MSSERLSRALLTAGDVFGGMAQLSWQREQQQAEAEREENMLRLRQKLNLEELDKRQGFDEKNEQTRFKNNMTVAEREAALRAEEGEKGRRFQASQSAADRQMQRDNWTRQDREQLERQSMAQISSIDEQILNIRDAIDKGEYVDPAKAEEQVNALAERRRALQEDMVIRLADMGDPRFPEAKEPAAGGRAAQAPEISPPPKSPAEARQERKASRKLLPSGDSTPIQGKDMADVARQFLDRQSSSRRDAFQAESQRKALTEAVREFNTAFIRGKPIPASVKSTLKSASAEARAQAGFNDEYLSYLN